jgi:hypothetical protein
VEEKMGEIIKQGKNINLQEIKCLLNLLKTNGKGGGNEM